MVRGFRFEKSLRPCLCAALGVSLLSGCGGPTEEDAVRGRRSGDYLGEPPPGVGATVFAPGLISTRHRQRDTAISPDGTRFAYTVWGEGRGTLVFLERQDEGTWSAPEVAPFSGVHSDIEPFFHPRDDLLLFASKRPLEGETDPGDWNLWSVRFDDEGWAAPAVIEAVSAEGDEYYPAVTNDGTIYFTAQREGSLGGEDIFRAKATANGYAEAENLGEPVNSEGPDFNAYVAPDEGLLIFSSIREGDHGGGDLYASFRNDDGSWTEALNLGPRVNGPALDYCPFVTPDGRYLYFTSTRTAADAGPRRTYAELMDALDGPMNGQGSVYWIDAHVLEEISGARMDSD